MTIKFVEPKSKPDLVAASREFLTLAIASMGLFDPTTAPLSYVKFSPRAYKHIEKIALAVSGTKEANPENLAWTWLSLTLAEASSRYLAWLRRKTILSAAKKDQCIHSFLEKSMDIPMGAEFSSDVMTDGAVHPIFSNSKAAARELIFCVSNLTSLPKGHDVAFDDCLASAIQYVTAKHYDALSSLIEVVSGDASVPVRRNNAWLRHYQWIHNRFLETPVFSPDETVSIPLVQLYLRPRCVWHERIDDGDDENGSQKVKLKASVGYLHHEMEQWLLGERKNPVRVIAGGPGSGKSSFARAFASEVSASGMCRVMFIELQRIKFTGNLLDDIGRCFIGRDGAAHGGGSAGFPENPLMWIKNDNRPALIIFDGLDELTFDEAEAKVGARDFILQASNLVANCNSDGANLKAVILGRNTACQSGLDAASLPLQVMLNVAPIYKLTENDLKPQRSPTDKFDPAGTIFPKLEGSLVEDQRSEYWSNWSKANKLPKQDMPKSITHEDLSELNSEPLLLHLMILSDFCGERWREAVENPNLVYEDLLVKIHKRNTGKLESKTPKKYRDFITLMECLGLTAWRGNGRAGSPKEYEEVLKFHARRMSAQGIVPTDLKSVVLQTHARSVEGSGGGFEFIHKSFGEFLAARGIVSLALVSSRRLSNVDDPMDVETIARDWVGVVGGAKMNSEVLEFIKREAVRQLPNQNSDVLVKDLEKIASWVQVNGFPVLEKNDGSFRKVETVQRCSEVAIFAAGVTLCEARVKREGVEGETFNVKWGDNAGAGAFLNRGQSLQAGISLPYLPGLNFSGQLLFFQNLVALNLSRGKFQGALLFGANFTGSNLSDSNFSGSITSQSIFNGCSLSGCEMSGCKLNAAFLKDVSCIDANLSEIVLSNSTLTDVDFSTSNLTGADFSHAILRDVNFSSANLTNAKFEDSILINVNFNEAKTEGVKFENATSVELPRSSEG